MRPHRAVTMCLRASWQQTCVALALTPITTSQCFSVTPSGGAIRWMPALFTRAWNPAERLERPGKESRTVRDVGHIDDEW